MTAMLGKNQSIIDNIKIEIVKEDGTYCYSINTEKGHLYLAQSETLCTLKEHLIEDLNDILDGINK